MVLSCPPFSHVDERVLAIIWTWVMEPMLFVTIGSSIDFSTIGGGTIPRSILIVCTGELCGHHWQGICIGF